MASRTIQTGLCLKRLSRLWTVLLVLLALLCSAGLAMADGAASAGAGQALTYSAVVRLLGEPPVSRIKTERWQPQPVSGHGRAQSGFFEKPVLTGGEHEWAYPALGLTFVIDRLDRPLADPPVHYLRYARTQPADAPAAALSLAASTALGLHGLRLGQPQSVALEAAALHLQPLQPISAGAEAAGSGAARVGRALFAGRFHHVELRFRDGLLHEVWLDYKPQRLLTRTQRWWMAAAIVLAVGLVAWAATWALGRWKVSIALPFVGAGVTRAVGHGFVVAGGLVAGAGLLTLLYVAASLAGLADLGGGQVYAGHAVALLGLYGLTGLMGGAVLLGVGKKIASLV